MIISYKFHKFPYYTLRSKQNSTVQTLISYVFLLFSDKQLENWAIASFWHWQLWACIAEGGFSNWKDRNLFHKDSTSILLVYCLVFMVIYLFFCSFELHIQWNYHRKHPLLILFTFWIFTAFWHLLSLSHIPSYVLVGIIRRRSFGKCSTSLVI